MDLVTVMQGVPSLLFACVGGEKNPAWKPLRLVSKEASHVALLAYETHSLIFWGDDNDTSIDRAGLLTSTRLKTLCLSMSQTESIPALPLKRSVHQPDAGRYRPGDFLRLFLQEAGTSLRTVTKLFIRTQEWSRCTTAAAALYKSLEPLVSACPALKSLDFKGHIPMALVHCLAEHCPLLCELKIDADEVTVSDLQSILDQLPSLLPRVSCLHLTSAWDDQPTKFPDMSRNVGIINLDLCSRIFDMSAFWSRLPPSLQILTCGGFQAYMTVPSSPTGLLGSLVCLKTGSTVALSDLVLFLQAAPALQNIHLGETPLDARVTLSFDCATSADLQDLSERMHVLRDPLFEIECGTDWIEEPLQAFYSSLPCMQGITRLSLLGFEHEQLAPLLGLFPNLQHLILEPLGDFDSVQLQDLKVCANLTVLRMFYCNNVSSEGLVMLCKELPKLKRISHFSCDGLIGANLEECVQLLASQHVNVELQSLHVGLSHIT